MLRLEYITDWLQRYSGNSGATSQTVKQDDADGLPWWVTAERPPLDELARQPATQLPPFVQQCPVAQRYLRQLGALDWSHFPEPPLRHWAERTPEPRAHFVAAFLVKLQEAKTTMPALRTFLVEHPALLWVLGFHLHPEPTMPLGFDPERSLPTHRHFSRILRTLPNDALQFLLGSSVQLLRAALPDEVSFGDEITLDTKHILAWVKENNPKAFVPERFDKQRQPKGDPDCKLGCKKKSNERKATDATSAAAPATPASEGLPASGALPTLEKGEYYWGYASGVVATKVPGYGEFVLADFTQTFDKGDQTYFHPLMARTEQNLGRKPKSGALDKAYDAFYVYEYFHDAGGFAAVPWADRQDHHKTFSPDGLPLCEAALPMPRKSTFWMKSHCHVPHEVGRYVCPLLFPDVTGETCPVAHKNWANGGCITSLPTSVGNKIRHQLDRASADYKRVFNQRTAVERINSQAKELGIERPKLRNQDSIANINTLIYVLINLRALQRLKERPLKT
jgi:hypothetical protein